MKAFFDANHKDNLTIIIVTIKSEKIIDNCLSSIDSDVKKIVIENSNNEEFINNLKNMKILSVILLVKI